MFFAEEKINSRGKYVFLWRRRKTEIEENVWRRKINFLQRSFWNTGFGNTGNQSQDGETKLPV